MLSTNRERAVATLIREGALHRADLARRLSVSRTTASNVVQDLVAEGLIEVEDAPGLKAKLSVSPQLGVLVSVVFQLTRTTIAVGGMDGAVLDVRDVAHAVHDHGTARLATALDLARQMLAEAGAPTVRAVHIAVNTQVDVRTGEVVGAGASAMWARTNPRRTFSEALQAPVKVENTARLLGLVEHLAGTGGPSRNLLYLHLGHGVTLGQILDGHIVQGSRGGAGEIGHMSIERDGPACSCRSRGCLMQYVGEVAVTARAQRVLGDLATVEYVTDRALAGDPDCRELVAAIGADVGYALANVANLLDPDVIVLGGKLAAAGELLAEPVREEILSHALPLTTQQLVVTTAAATADPVAVAAAGLRPPVSDPELLEEIVRSALR